MPGLVERYKATLKPLSVEEPIDVVWHRLLGYVLARLAFPTRVSADAISVAAIAIGFASGACIAIPFEHHMLVGAGLCTLSAIFDCADGQLARMRKTSSSFGRMLDGVSDSLVMAAIFAGVLIHFFHQRRPWWFFAVALITAPICTFHFGHYDHYKNLYLRLTEESFREGEDLEVALERKRVALLGTTPGLVMRFVWWLYLVYVGSQTRLIRRTDPFTKLRLHELHYDPARAAIYEKHALGPMRMWRSFFGLGTHVFTFSILCALDRLEWYVLFRLGLLDLVAYGWLIWWQRRASRRAFEEMGLS